MGRTLCHPKGSSQWSGQHSEKRANSLSQFLLTLSDILPSKLLPDNANEFLEDMSGEREKLFMKPNSGKPHDTPLVIKHKLKELETEIVIKLSGSSEFPTSFQITPFGRHLMVLSKRRKAK